MAIISLAGVTGRGQVEVQSHLSVTLCFGQPHVPEHLRPLFHHQRALVRVGGDVTVVLPVFRVGKKHKDRD